HQVEFRNPAALEDEIDGRADILDRVGSGRERRILRRRRIHRRRPRGAAVAAHLDKINVVTFASDVFRPSMSKTVSDGYVAPWTKSTTRSPGKLSRPSRCLFRTCNSMPGSAAGIMKVSKRIRCASADAGTSQMTNRQVTTTKRRTGVSSPPDGY